MIPHPIYIVNNFFLFYQGKLYYTTLYITTTFYQFYFNFFLKPPLFSSNRHTRLYAPEINLLSFNIVFPQTEPEILHQYPVFFRCQRYIFLSLRDIQNERIIPLHENERNGMEVMDKNPELSPSQIFYILSLYIRLWRQRLLSEHIPLSPAHALTTPCLRCFGRQFMQVKSTRNVLFIPPT